MFRYNGDFIPDEKLFPLGVYENIRYFVRRDAVGIYKTMGRELLDADMNDLPVEILDRADKEFGFFFDQSNRCE